MQEDVLLVPAPRNLEWTGGSYIQHHGSLIELPGANPQSLLFIAQRVQRAVQDCCGTGWEVVAGDAAPEDQVALRIAVQPQSSIPTQGYELEISARGSRLTGRDLPGVFYGACTLIQIIQQCGTSLPSLRITDWPDFPARGVMLDVSRDRVPTMRTLYQLVDQLAGWKINQLQLYTEHTFAYRRHPQVWKNASPFTGQEILELDRFCRERFIDLVPNQQSFGHLAPWLNLPDYKHLAEVQDGYQTPWGYREGSFSLSPVGSQSINFLHGLYAELLPHFSSQMFNVGCDETWDLGQGHSQEECQRTGKGRVYLNFLHQIYDEVKCFGKIPQFWGDIIVEHPELIPELPKDMIALEWGYEAAHPFDAHGAQFSASGIPFYVCPGTSSWCSIAGRTDNALENLRSAAEQGLRHGAIGYLNTDWGDYGHWQVWPVSSLGLMAGAAYAWALESNQALDIAKALSWHAFRDTSGTMGNAAYRLGNIYRAVGIEPHNASVLFWVMQWPLEKICAYPGLTLAAFERSLTSVEETTAAMQGAKMAHPDANLIHDEFALTIEMLRHACKRGMLAFETDAARVSALKDDLSVSLSHLLEDHQRIWLMRNRSGGLTTSTARLEKLKEDYDPGAGGDKPRYNKIS
jgi:hypothetical protein